MLWQCVLFFPFSLFFGAETKFLSLVVTTTKTEKLCDIFCPTQASLVVTTAKIMTSYYERKKELRFLQTLRKKNCCWSLLKMKAVFSLPVASFDSNFSYRSFISLFWKVGRQEQKERATFWRKYPSNRYISLYYSLMPYRYHVYRVIPMTEPIPYTIYLLIMEITTVQYISFRLRDADLKDNYHCANAFLLCTY